MTHMKSTELWRWSFGEFAMLSGLSLFIIVLFADETWYNRDISMASQPSRGSKIARLTGFGRPGPNTAYTLRESVERLFLTFTKLPVFLTCMSYGLTFAWVVGINVR